MAHIDWYIEGPAYGNCNCGYACPCQFEEDPTQGNCRGLEVMEITKGHFGEVVVQALPNISIMRGGALLWRA